MLATSGKLPARPLMAIRAYADLRIFGVLPHAGGTFDQPADLLDDMRYVAAIVDRAERQREEAERRRVAARGRRG